MLRSLLASAHKTAQSQRNRNNRQRARQLDCDSLIQRRRPQAKHSVPSGRRCRNRRSVIHRSSGKNTEGLTACCRKAQHRPQPREEQCGQYIEEKDNADSLRHLLIICLDDRRCRCHSTAAADRRAYADERGNFPRYTHCLMQHIGHNERGRNCADDNRQRLSACRQHYGNIQTEAKQNNRILQHLFRNKAYTAFKRSLYRPHQRHQHT